ncbi:helix-turn-helix domain-containing protein [Streptomyces sp. NBC_00986]|uniref:helix-turn-helix domain-containing protein n=1 Tax=Streptomyces sp. NBC_00986 TaxID=2903702 RepID=UPI003863B76D|nr:helix-turn-helix domain-containing protein [Streptomyces sp. NBC_00986]
MRREVDPSLNRRKLRIALRRAREAAGLSREEAAGQVDWSVSKLNRIETGTVSVALTDLRALVQLYRLEDPETVDDLENAARNSKGQSWWAPFAGLSAPRFYEYLGFETAATSLRTYHPVVIPGLLHTEEYADALAVPELPDAVFRRKIVEFRTARQERVFDEDTGIDQLHFVVDEAALRRRIGEPDVMRRQLQHLKNMAEHPRVTLQVLPFSAGALLSTQTAFVLLSFKDEEDLIYLEFSQAGSIATRDNFELVANFQDSFEQLRNLAYSGTQALDLIDDAKEAFSVV